MTGPISTIIQEGKKDRINMDKRSLKKHLYYIIGCSTIIIIRTVRNQLFYN